MPNVLPLPLGDEPTFTYWHTNVQVNNQINTVAEYPRLCVDECKKNCSTFGEEDKCFGKIHISKHTTYRTGLKCGT